MTTQMIEVLARFKNQEGEIITTVSGFLPLQGRGKMSEPVTAIIKGIDGKKATVPRLCGNCMFHFPDHTRNRQRYGDIDYPYCPVQEKRTEANGYCLSHAFVNYILMHPEEWAGA